MDIVKQVFVYILMLTCILFVGITAFGAETGESELDTSSAAKVFRLRIAVYQDSATSAFDEYIEMGPGAIGREEVFERQNYYRRKRDENLDYMKTALKLERKTRRKVVEKFGSERNRREYIYNKTLAIELKKIYGPYKIYF